MKLFCFLIFSLSPLYAAAHPPIEFQGPDRPVHNAGVYPHELRSLMNKGAMLIDVRLAKDFEKDPAMIPDATRGDPEQIFDWAHKIPADKSVIVYCVKGGWVSHKAAAYLKQHGLDAYVLFGGRASWQTAQED